MSEGNRFHTELMDPAVERLLGVRLAIECRVLPFDRCAVQGRQG